MYNTIPFQRSNPLQGVSQLAKTISLPHEFAPIRYPSFPALERTAVMGFNYNSTVTVPANVDTFGMACRSATYPVWFDQSFTSQVYQVQYSLETATTVESFHYVSGGIVRNWAMGAQPTASNVVGIVGGTAPSIPYPIFGVDNAAAVGGREWIFVPAGFTLGVALCAGTTFTVNTTVSVRIERWSSPGETFTSTPLSVTTVATDRSAGASTLISANNGNWVRLASLRAAITPNLESVFFVVSAGTLTFAPAVATTGVFTVTPAAAFRALYPAFYPVEYTNSSLPWFSTRTTASALLATNVTQALNKGGTVLAGRVSPQVQNAWYVTRSYLSGLHPAEKALIGLEEGFYTYVPPSTDMVDFWDYSLNTGLQAPSAPVFRLDNTSLNNIFIFSVPVDSAFAINADLHIEFRTSSTLWQIGMSTLTLEAFHQAQIELMSHGFFYNNSNHTKLKAFFQKAKTVASSKLGKTAIGLASGLLPPQARAAASLAATGYKLLSSKPGAVPKATTLAVRSRKPRKTAKGSTRPKRAGKA